MYDHLPLTPLREMMAWLFFDATGLPSGAYFYRLKTGDLVEPKSLILSK